MSKIFINYRREDTAAYAGRLYDHLVAHFGDDNLFMDIDQIEPGEDFEEVIEQKANSVKVALVLIGRNWLTVTDAAGQRRLDNIDDFVRLEIATLLDRKIRVIPVLVGGAVMPKASQLPPSLALLVRRNAIEIRDIGFRQDIDRLIETLKKIMVDPVPEASLEPNKASQWSTSSTPDPLSDLDSRVKSNSTTEGVAPTVELPGTMSSNVSRKWAQSNLVIIIGGGLALVFGIGLLLSNVNMKADVGNEASRKTSFSNKEVITEAESKEEMGLASAQDAKDDSPVISQGNKKLGWVYLGDYSTSEKKWKTRYFDFDPTVDPIKLPLLTLKSREEMGTINVRVDMPSEYGELQKVKDVLKPRSSVRVKSVKAWNSTGWFWAEVEYDI